MVYKRCSGILKELWKILRCRGRVAKQWRYASGVWIPKEKNYQSIEQFRTTFLLNTESKTFMSAMSHRLTKFLLGNGYIDTSVQKGWLSGTHQHNYAGLERSKGEQKQLGCLVVDLANAYESI